MALKRDVTLDLSAGRPREAAFDAALGFKLGHFVPRYSQFFLWRIAVFAQPWHALQARPHTSKAGLYGGQRRRASSTNGAIWPQHRLSHKKRRNGNDDIGHQVPVQFQPEAKDQWKYDLAG